jgi:hypothetical protein
MKLTASIIIFCIFTQIIAMEQTPQGPGAHHYDPASLQGLPPELKKLLIPFVVSGTLKDMTFGLYKLATIDKWFHAYVNDLDNMIAILNGLPRICNRLDVLRTLRLHCKTKSLPVFKDPNISALARVLHSTPLKYGPELFYSASANDQTKLKKLLQEHDINLYYTDLHGHSILECATKSGHIEIIRLLLAAGMDPDMRSSDSKTALIKATSLAGTTAIELLLSAGAGVSMTDTYGNAALIFAIANGNIAAVKILVAAGALIWKDDYVRARKLGYHEIATFLEEEKERKYVARWGKSWWDCAIA